MRLSLLLACLAAIAIIGLGCSKKPSAPPLPGDRIPPAAVKDLRAATFGTSIVFLRWTAPGDDSLTGRAYRYDLRYRPQPITPDSFLYATEITTVPVPAAAGWPESLMVSTLGAGRTYYYALRTKDDNDNISAVSNVSQATTALTDQIPPKQVIDLSADQITQESARLTWTAPGDDSIYGRAASYDIRYSSEPLTEGNWAIAARVFNAPAPADPGTSQQVVVGGLVRSVDFHFGLRTQDKAGNISLMSNGLTVRTPGPGPRVWRVRADGTGDAPTIQKAIESATDGDQVLVGPGTYYENIDYLGKQLAVVGEQGAEATIINGSRRSASVVNIRGYQSRSTVLQGFTLTKGTGSPVTGTETQWPEGGGIFVQDAEPTIQSCIIIDNGVITGSPGTSTGWGGRDLLRGAELHSFMVAVDSLMSDSGQ